MKKNKILYFEDIGNVVLVKSQRAKRLNISIKPFQDVRVAVPRGMTYAQAEKFLYQRLDWIKKQQPKIQALEKNMTIFDEHTPFCTRHHQLQIVRSEVNKFVVRTVNGRISVTCPFSIDIKSEEVQASIREGIERAWRKEAKAYLPGRVKTLAQGHGFTYQRLFIKNTKTRWGSCSVRNNINLSLHLMRLPDHLIDYVVLHELVHTVEKNHSQRFWGLLDKVSGNAKALDTEMKGYNIKIY